MVQVLKAHRQLQPRDHPSGEWDMLGSDESEYRKGQEGKKDVSPAVGGSGKNPLRVIFQIWGKNGGNDPRAADRKDDKDKTIRLALCLLASDRRVAESWRRQRQMSARKKRREPEDSEHHGRGKALAGSKCSPWYSISV